jgi:hypothetical protein
MTAVLVATHLWAVSYVASFTDNAACQCYVLTMLRCSTGCCFCWKFAGTAHELLNTQRFLRYTKYMYATVSHMLTTASTAGRTTAHSNAAAHRHTAALLRDVKCTSDCKLA